ncbi:hypothetical protein ABT56_11805 [Photobacterium aquae]|uniref:Peptidase S1 domain-containing protein n=1 Tax=Photobacterium aquae TaxID=1195763 RepID=A0A0J1H0R1_9GAMM|nr:serine protease [Photobacterium aquae]KLV05394.1 hypothetical protein ABT56_11805 [Photobacterium aquae]
MKKLILSPIVLALACTSLNVTASTEIQPRVLNGSEISKINNNLLPWQAAMVMQSEFDFSTRSGCGAVVISDTWAVTAAHCIIPAMTDILIAGTHHIPNANGDAANIDGKYKFNIIRKIVHPNFDLSISANDDIALLQVDRSMMEVAKPIKVATADEQHLANQAFDNTWTPSAFSKANLIASGWGASQPYFTQPDELMVVKLAGIPINSCKPTYSLDANSHFVCADSNNPDIKKDVCRGDSGGPLVWQNPNHASDSDFGLRVIGVTSNGPYCEPKNAGMPQAQYNGLYTELASYYPWIELKTGLDLAAVPASSFDADPFIAIPDTKPAAKKNTGSSGGGSIPLTALAALAGLAILRRKK